jgi:hypothetical protein
VAARAVAPVAVMAVVAMAVARVVAVRAAVARAAVRAAAERAVAAKAAVRAAAVRAAVVREVVREVVRAGAMAVAMEVVDWVVARVVEVMAGARAGAETVVVMVAEAMGAEATAAVKEVGPVEGQGTVDGPAESVATAAAAMVVVARVAAEWALLVPRAALRGSGVEAAAAGEKMAEGPASGTAAGPMGTQTSISTRGTARLGSTVGCGTRSASRWPETTPPPAWDRRKCCRSRRGAGPCRMSRAAL